MMTANEIMNSFKKFFESKGTRHRSVRPDGYQGRPDVDVHKCRYEPVERHHPWH